MFVQLYPLHKQGHTQSPNSGIQENIIIWEKV